MAPVCKQDKHVLALRSCCSELHQLVHYALYRVESNVLEGGEGNAEALTHRLHVLEGGLGDVHGQVLEARMTRVVVHRMSA